MQFLYWMRRAICFCSVSFEMVLAIVRSQLECDLRKRSAVTDSHYQQRHIYIHPLWRCVCCRYFLRQSRRVHGAFLRLTLRDHFAIVIFVFYFFSCHIFGLREGLRSPVQNCQGVFWFLWEGVWWTAYPFQHQVNLSVVWPTVLRHMNFEYIFLVHVRSQNSWLSCECYPCSYSFLFELILELVDYGLPQQVGQELLLTAQPAKSKRKKSSSSSGIIQPSLTSGMLIDWKVLNRTVVWHVLRYCWRKHLLQRCIYTEAYTSPAAYLSLDLSLWSSTNIHQYIPITWITPYLCNEKTSIFACTCSCVCVCMNVSTCACACVTERKL